MNDEADDAVAKDADKNDADDENTYRSAQPNWKTFTRAWLSAALGAQIGGHPGQWSSHWVNKFT